MLREMSRLLRTTGRGPVFLLLLLLRCPFDAAMTLINAWFLQRAFDAILVGDSSRLGLACGSFLIASLCLFLYNGTVWSLYAPFVVRMEGRIRRLMFAKIAALPNEKIDAAGSGEWMTRLNTDVQMPFSRPLHLPHAVCALVNIGVSALVLWRLNPAVLGWVLLFVVPHILFSQLVIARAMPRLQQASLQQTAQNTGDLATLITCAEVGKLYDAQEYLLGRFAQSSLDLRRANMRMRRRSALGAGILPLFGIGGYLVLLVVCSGWIAGGALTFGDLTAAFELRGGILKGAMMLVGSLVNIHASLAGIRRLNETLSEETEAPHG